MSIIIFSRPIHSGKTSELLHWCDKHVSSKISGVLMPDIDGARKIYNIQTKEIFDIECKDPANTKEPLQSVGHYHFFSKAFEKANAILLEASASESNWVIIDEAGKLELQCNGLYEAIKNLTARSVYQTPDKNLLIVVRDSLYESVVSFFNIPDHTLVHQLNEITLSAVADPDSGN